MPVVIHTGLRLKMRDYAQESGSKSKAIMWRECWQGPEGRVKEEQGWKGTKQAMKDSVLGEQCKRIVLDREMDGRVNRPGCAIGEESCDVCQERSRGTRRVGIAVGHRNEGD
jgi:hypothetical protein